MKKLLVGAVLAGAGAVAATMWWRKTNAPQSPQPPVATAWPSTGITEAPATPAAPVPDEAALFEVEPVPEDVTATPKRTRKKSATATNDSAGDPS